jgi:hypothetical protein
MRGRSRSPAIFPQIFFGPVAEVASKNLTALEIDILKQSHADHASLAERPTLCYFDNLNGDLQTNSV